MTANVYFWRDVPNFGDRIGLDLLEHFTGVPARWAEMEFADVVVTGSVIEQIPSGWTGAVAGAGVLTRECSKNLMQANVLAVRGPLSRERIECNNKSSVVMGDPALLADELVDVTTRDRQLGILPHWTDTRLQYEGVFQPYNPLFISPFDDPKTVVANVGRCQKLVTSSLHGLILADSFGIPRRYEKSPRMLPEEGGQFKFHDYHRSIGLPFEVGVTQQADRNRVEDMKNELFDVLSEMRPFL